MMKIRLLILVIFLTYFNVQGQKVKSDKVDDFTGNRNVFTSEETIGKGLESATTQMIAAVVSKDSSIEWGITFKISTNVLTSSMSRGDKIIFLFENNEVKETINLAEFHYAGKYDYLKPFVVVDQELGELLRKTPIKKIRIHTSKFYMDCAASEKQKDIYIRFMALLDTHLGEKKRAF